MAREYDPDERARILAESYELLSRDGATNKQVSEPEWTPEQNERLLREAMARPVETRNQRARREITERNVAWAAKREADTMEKLEARLNAKIADERERIFKTIAQVVADGIFEPYEKRFTELEEAIRTRRDPVSVTAAAINHKGELMLTLSDGTILTPGRIGREAEVLDLPNPLAARRMR